VSGFTSGTSCHVLHRTKRAYPRQYTLPTPAAQAPSRVLVTCFSEASSPVGAAGGAAAAVGCGAAGVIGGAAAAGRSWVSVSSTSPTEKSITAEPVRAAGAAGAAAAALAAADGVGLAAKAGWPPTSAPPTQAVPQARHYTFAATGGPLVPAGTHRRGGLGGLLRLSARDAPLLVAVRVAAVAVAAAAGAARVCVVAGRSEAPHPRPADARPAPRPSGKCQSVRGTPRMTDGFTRAAAAPTQAGAQGGDAAKRPLRSSTQTLACARARAATALSFRRPSPRPPPAYPTAAPPPRPAGGHRGAAAGDSSRVHRRIYCRLYMARQRTSWARLQQKQHTRCDKRPTTAATIPATPRAARPGTAATAASSQHMTVRRKPSIPATSQTKRLSHDSIYNNGRAVVRLGSPRHQPVAKLLRTAGPSEKRKRGSLRRFRIAT